MAHHVCGAPLLYSSGAPDIGAPLVSSLLMAHHTHGAPLLIFSAKLIMAHHVTGAPLVTKVNNGTLLGGAPLVT